jgi:rhodanese-related sulfurtransferase
LAVCLGKVRVAKTRDVQEILTTQKIPERLNELLPKNGGRVLVVCMVGGTSLQVAKLLAKRNVRAESLSGGIAGLSVKNGRQLRELLRIARA